MATVSSKTKLPSDNSDDSNSNPSPHGKRQLSSLSTEHVPKFLLDQQQKKTGDDTITRKPITNKPSSSSTTKAATTAGPVSRIRPPQATPMLTQHNPTRSMLTNQQQQIIPQSTPGQSRLLSTNQLSPPRFPTTARQTRANGSVLQRQQQQHQHLANNHLQSTPSMSSSSKSTSTETTPHTTNQHIQQGRNNNHTLYDVDIDEKDDAVQLLSNTRNYVLNKEIQQSMQQLHPINKMLLLQNSKLKDQHKYNTEQCKSQQQQVDDIETDNVILRAQLAALQYRIQQRDMAYDGLLANYKTFKTNNELLLNKFQTLKEKLLTFFETQNNLANNKDGDDSDDNNATMSFKQLLESYKAQIITTKQKQKKKKENDDGIDNDDGGGVDNDKDMNEQDITETDLVNQMLEEINLTTTNKYKNELEQQLNIYNNINNMSSQFDTLITTIYDQQTAHTNALQEKYETQRKIQEDKINHIIKSIHTLKQTLEDHDSNILTAATINNDNDNNVSDIKSLVERIDNVITKSNNNQHDENNTNRLKQLSKHTQDVFNILTQKMQKLSDESKDKMADIIIIPTDDGDTQNQNVDNNINTKDDSTFNGLSEVETLLNTTSTLVATYMTELSDKFKTQQADNTMLLTKWANALEAVHDDTTKQYNAVLDEYSQYVNTLENKLDNIYNHHLTDVENFNIMVKQFKSQQDQAIDNKDDQYQQAFKQQQSELQQHKAQLKMVEHFLNNIPQLLASLPQTNHNHDINTAVLDDKMKMIQSNVDNLTTQQNQNLEQHKTKFDIERFEPQNLPQITEINSDATCQAEDNIEKKQTNDNVNHNDNSKSSTKKNKKTKKNQNQMDNDNNNTFNNVVSTPTTEQEVTLDLKHSQSPKDNNHGDVSDENDIEFKSIENQNKKPQGHAEISTTLKEIGQILQTLPQVVNFVQEQQKSHYENAIEEMLLKQQHNFDTLQNQHINTIKTLQEQHNNTLQDTINLNDKLNEKQEENKKQIIDEIQNVVDKIVIQQDNKLEDVIGKLSNITTVLQQLQDQQQKQHELQMQQYLSIPKYNNNNNTKSTINNTSSADNDDDDDDDINGINYSDSSTSQHHGKLGDLKKQRRNINTRGSSGSGSSRFGVDSSPRLHQFKHNSARINRLTSSASLFSPAVAGALAKSKCGLSTPTSEGSSDDIDRRINSNSSTESRQSSNNNKHNNGNYPPGIWKSNIRQKNSKKPQFKSIDSVLSLGNHTNHINHHHYHQHNRSNSLNYPSIPPTITEGSTTTNSNISNHHNNIQNTQSPPTDKNNNNNIVHSSPPTSISTHNVQFVDSDEISFFTHDQPSVLSSIGHNFDIAESFSSGTNAVEGTTPITKYNALQKLLKATHFKDVVTKEHLTTNDIINNQQEEKQQQEQTQQNHNNVNDDITPSNNIQHDTMASNPQNDENSDSSSESQTPSSNNSEKLRASRSYSTAFNQRFFPTRHKCEHGDEDDHDCKDIGCHNQNKQDLAHEYLRGDIPTATLSRTSTHSSTSSTIISDSIMIDDEDDNVDLNNNYYNDDNNQTDNLLINNNDNDNTLYPDNYDYITKISTTNTNRPSACRVMTSCVATLLLFTLLLSSLFHIQQHTKYQFACNENDRSCAIQSCLDAPNDITLFNNLQRFLLFPTVGGTTTNVATNSKLNYTKSEQRYLNNFQKRSWEAEFGKKITQQDDTMDTDTDDANNNNNNANDHTINPDTNMLQDDSLLTEITRDYIKEPLYKAIYGIIANFSLPFSRF